MSHKTKFELWWREVSQLTWTIETFTDAAEYQRRKRELVQNFDDALFGSGVEILPAKEIAL